VSNYSKDEVWVAARFIWENTPEITDRELIEQLQIKYGNAAPKSTGTISKRRKKEAWGKQSLVKPVKNSGIGEAGRAGSEKNRKQEAEKPSTISSKTNKAQRWEAAAELEAAGSKIGEITESVVIDAQGRAAIINKTRRRYANLGKLFDQAIDITLGIPDLAAAAEQVEREALEGDFGADFEIGENDEGSANAVEAAVQKVKKAMMLSKALTDTTTSLAIALKTISEVEMPLCGITPEDFSQSDRDRRLDSLEALAGIQEEEEAMREKLHQQLQDRMSRVEQFESDPDFFLEDDTEDVEFSEVNDD